MTHAAERLSRRELRRVGLPDRGALPGLLALLRASPETHLSLAEVARMAAESGLAVTSAALTRHLKALADHGLLGQLPTTAAELVFDTVPEPHSHLIYEEPAQIVDLQVSVETLLTIVRKALAERADGVEVLVRFRRDAVAAPDRRLRGERPGAGTQGSLRWQGQKRTHREVHEPKTAKGRSKPATPPREFSKPLPKKK